MHKLRRHETPAGRAVFESSDSTDDVENSLYQSPPSLPPLSPPHTHKVVALGTPTTGRKKMHIRRKRRSVENPSPERDVPPLTVVSRTSHPPPRRPPTGKSVLLVTPNQPSSRQYLPRDQHPHGKTLHVDLHLREGEHTDGSRTAMGGTEVNDSIEPPITPGGSLSPAVDELIKSLQKVPSRTHRRMGSGGSITSPPTQRRSTATSNGSKQSDKTVRNPCTPSHGLSYVSSIDKQQRLHPPLEMFSGHRDSGKGLNGILYSNLDSSDSDSDPETLQEQDNSNYSSPATVRVRQDREKRLTSDTRELSSNSPSRNTHYPLTVPSVSKPQLVAYTALSNESSCEVMGTDGHDADSESNYGETESMALSFSLSRTPTSVSPLPLSSTSVSDQHNISSLSSLASAVPDFPSPSDTLTTNTPREVTPAAEEIPRVDAEQNIESVSGSSHQGQVKMLISQFEVGGNEVGNADANDLSRSEENDLSGSPRLEIPLHIRREQQHLSGSYSPVRVENALSLLHNNALGNSTSIVRHFFENIVSKGLPEVGMHRQAYSTTELEDSGFQVGYWL